MSTSGAIENNLGTGLGDCRSGIDDCMGWLDGPSNYTANRNPYQVASEVFDNKCLGIVKEGVNRATCSTNEALRDSNSKSWLRENELEISRGSDRDWSKMCVFAFLKRKNKSSYYQIGCFVIDTTTIGASFFFL